MAKTEHRRWLERMAREADRERLRRARQAVKDARASRRSLKARARETCRAAKLAVRDWAKAERERLRRERLELRETHQRKKAEACNVCTTGRAKAKLDGDAGLTVARAALELERDAQRRERLWKRKGPSRSAAEVRSESEDEVRANLSPDELIVWEQVKGRIKGTSRMSRTEAFAHWVHEHPEEVSRLLEKQVAKELKELEREVEREQKRFREGVSKASDKELEQRIRESVAPKAPDAPLPTWLPILPEQDEEEGYLALLLYLEGVHDHAKILPELQRLDDATFARVLRQKTPEGIADNRRYLAERVRDYFFGGDPAAQKEWVRRADLASGARTPAPARHIGQASERLAKRGAQKARKKARARADDALIDRELAEVDLPRKLLGALARARKVRDQVAAGEADIKAWNKAIANAYRVHNKVVWDEYRDTQHRDEGLDAIAELIRESDVSAAASDARQRARKQELERLREEEREEKAGTTEYVPGIGYVTHPARKREPVPF